MKFSQIINEQWSKVKSNKIPAERGSGTGDRIPTDSDTIPIETPPQPTPTPTPGQPTPTPTPTPAPVLTGNGFTDTTLTGDDLKAGKVVKYGMKGDIVGKIQELLIAKGFKDISRSGNVDKIFGNRTKAMVQAFQRANGLNDDGSVGKDTWPKLNDPNAVGASSSSPSSSAIQATSSSKPDEVAGSDAIIIQEERKKIFRKYLSQYK